MQMNSTMLSLTSSAQMFEGVELSKSQAGVTAKLSDSGFTITIFYDDNTAQISLTGAKTEILPLTVRNSVSSWMFWGVRIVNYAVF